jgi:hypothetical protein
LILDQSQNQEQNNKITNNKFKLQGFRKMIIGDMTKRNLIPFFLKLKHIVTTENYLLKRIKVQRICV